MKWLKAILTALATMVAGMYGGQKEKGVRRFGIPGLAIAMDWKRGLPLLLLIPVLAMGYGETSWLMGLIGNELFVRLAYSQLLALPFVFYGVRRWLISAILLGIVFQIHAGSLGNIPWIGDILVEDIIRYLTLGILISFNLFFYRKSN